MYVGGSPHKPYFIMLTLQRQIIIGPIKKIGWRFNVVGLIYVNMNVKKGVLLQSPPHVFNITSLCLVGSRV